MDRLWSVNLLAREVIRWIAACARRLGRIIDYIHHSKAWVQTSYVGDEPDKCWLTLYDDASFAGDLKGFKSISGCLFVSVGPNTFAPLAWLCKKQIAVSHSSSEAEIISSDAGVRMEGIPALLSWEEIIDVLAGGDSKPKASPPKHIQPKTMYDVLNGVDFDPPSFQMSSGKANCVIFEDNDAVINMTIKQCSPMMRHVARARRVDLDWLFEWLRKHSGLSIRFVEAKQQTADLFTKGSVTGKGWCNLFRPAQLGSAQAPMRNLSKAQVFSRQRDPYCVFAPPCFLGTKTGGSASMIGGSAQGATSVAFLCFASSYGGSSTIIPSVSDRTER